MKRNRISLKFVSSIDSNDYVKFLEYPDGDLQIRMYDRYEEPIYYINEDQQKQLYEELKLKFEK